MNGRRIRSLTIALAAISVLLGVPAIAIAHPLGNFTINHYAGIRVTPTAVLVDLVIDAAEIPAFQDRARLDTDAGGAVSPAEAATAAPAECDRLARSATLTVGGVPRPLVPTAAGLTFPPGAGGLPTMRTVCLMEAALPGPLTTSTEITFVDGSSPERIGWREVVVEGDGVTIASDLPTTSPSDRLTAYPDGLLGQPLDTREARLSASPGGPRLPPLDIRDAARLAGPFGTTTARPASVPGGVGSEISGLLATTDLSPLVLLASLLTAALLGAGHALTPGHGKTVMAAYLVGTRGTPSHAIGLGLAVTVSHTLGIVVLAGLVLAAGQTLPPERFQQLAPVLSAIVVLAIGAWMVARQARRAWADGGLRWPRIAFATVATVAVGGAHRAPSAHAHEHHDHHDRGHDNDNDNDHDHRQAHEHTHGLVRHRHLPADHGPVSWKGLVALGLAGGLVPSTSALLILLGTVATGRAGYGLVLVVAFGLGMAVVLAGIGLGLVLARDRVIRAGGSSPVPPRVIAAMPVVASLVVLGLGVYLTAQAFAGTTTL